MRFKIIDTGIADAQRNMEIDFELLQSLSETAEPILHFYEWVRPSVTYGHFINPHNYLCMDVLEESGIDLGRRPTGGGVIFHVSDVTFSILVPSSHPHYSANTLENYYYINSLVVKAIHQFLGRELPIDLLQQCKGGRSSEFCMAQPSVYDVMIRDKKVGGAAQRKTKFGFLHQASVSLAMPPFELLGKLLQDRGTVLNKMKEFSFFLLQGSVGALELAESKGAFRHALVETIDSVDQE